MAYRVEALYLQAKLSDYSTDDGYEIDPNTCASIFHQCGRMYRNRTTRFRDPVTNSLSREKEIDLKRSALFFNAAISRQPNNQEFVKDLQELCFHVLEVANAAKSSANLLEISKQVSSKVDSMRRYTQKRMKKVQNIPSCLSEEEWVYWEESKIDSIRNIQLTISKKYSRIMDYVSNRCIEILGKPPCKYCLVGMGSLARKEITPYSSFDHFVLLEDFRSIRPFVDPESMFEYFRMFRVLFYIVLTNLKETPILNLFLSVSNKRFVDDYTKNGILFNECNRYVPFSLTNENPKFGSNHWFSKVTPVDYIDHYISYVKESLKSNDYPFHSNNVSEVCLYSSYVSGCKNLHDRFVNEVEMELKKYRLDVNVLSRYKVDLERIDVISNLENLSHCSYLYVKQTVYFCVVLVLSILRNIFSVEETPTLDIIEVLKGRNIISKKKAHILSFCVALACEVRLKTCMSKSWYRDYIGGRNIFPSDGNALNLLTDLVGKRNVLVFFTTVKSLQSMFQLNDDDNKNLVSLMLKKAKIKTNILDNFEILRYLKLEGMFHEEFEKHKTSFSLTDNLIMQKALAELYVCLKNFEKALKIYDSLCKEDTNNQIVRSSIEGKVYCLYKLQRYGEVVKFLKEFVPELLLEHNNKSFRSRSFSYGCFEHPDSYDKLLTLSKIAFIVGDCRRYFQFCSLYNFEFDDDITNLRFYEEAIDSYRLCSDATEHYIERFKTTYINEKPPRAIRLLYDALFRTGLCQFALQQFSKAEKTIHSALRYALRCHVVEVSSIADCYALLEQCYAHLNRPAMALCYLVKQVNLSLRHSTIPEEIMEDALEDYKELLRRYYLSRRVSFSGFLSTDWFYQKWITNTDSNPPVGSPK